ncbi:hypothetical protein F5Y14DRAFT_417330 [Nemania sp. NC0429]|nr:hypothetical protein F5Y14DRAFT_417330 [Nemania sp. NC0429]
MLRFTESSEANKPGGSSKLGRIEIWRHEVAASRLSCVCSAPTVQEDIIIAGPGPGPGPRRSSSSPTRLSAPGNLLYKSIARLASPPSSSMDRDREGGEDSFFFPLAASGSEQGGSRQLSKRLNHNCSVCASPVVDGVAYKWLGRDGFGLVLARRKKNSPRLLSSFFGSRRRGGPENEGEMGKMLWERASQLFRRGKGVVGPSKNYCESSGSIISVQRRRAEADTDGLGAATMTTMAISPNGAPSRGNGTEMYRGTADDGEDEDMICPVSDDEGKRPTLGIDESAARLRRAQRLLNKNI